MNIIIDGLLLSIPATQSTLKVLATAIVMIPKSTSSEKIREIIKEKYKDKKMSECSYDAWEVYKPVLFTGKKGEFF